MTLKVHKKPWKMRPIVTCCGTFMNHWSKWLDHYFQKLTHVVPTHINSTTQLLNWISSINNLLPYSFAFTAKADPMRNNIDTKHAIKCITEWLDELSVLPDFLNNFPLEAVKSVMLTIMKKNNIFEFEDLNILQLVGTAMETSAACIWATIYYDYHKKKKILPIYE